MLKIDYITAHDPRNVQSWSGLNYFIMRSLKEQGAFINIITDLSAQPNFGLKWRYHWYLLQNKNYQYERTHCYARQFGEVVNRQLSANADIILATTTSALAYIKTSKPVFLYSDASFDNLAEYYDHFSRLPISSKKQGDQVEKKAYENCRGVFFSSKWAGDSAINTYGVQPSKIMVLPFGANLPRVPSRAEILEQIRHRNLQAPQLLWSGVEFERKGGPKAIEVTEKLRKAGYDARIILIGVTQEQTGCLPQFARAFGFLSKQVPQHLDLLKEVFSNSQFFVFPTKLDCSPVVLSEACAFGLPSFTPNIAGIPSIINDGVTGFLLNAEASAEDYYQKIQYLLQNPEKYFQLAISARNQYEMQLNWATIAKTMLKTFRAALRHDGT